MKGWGALGPGAVIALGVSTAAPARADLMAEADALRTAWARGGAEAERVATLFLGHDERRVLAVPWQPDTRRPCVTVVAIAERAIDFTLADGDSASGTTGPDPREQRARVGVAQLRRCLEPAAGPARRPLLPAVVVTFGAARGAVEVLAVRHAGLVEPIELVLPERALGPVPPRGEPGGGLALDPVSARTARARATAERDGARAIGTIETVADPQGAGAKRLQISAGCHRLVVLADPAPLGGAAIDVDAELLPEGAAEPIAGDRSHAPDARLDFCLGAPGKVELRFAGAGGPTAVTVLDAHWPSEPGLPARWPPRDRAGLGWALHRRHAPPVREEPSLEIIGWAGLTAVPLALEPGSCYLGAVAVTGGVATTARIAAALGEQSYFDEASEPPHAAAIAFCAERHRQGVLRLDVRGRQASWRAALWRLKGPAAP